MEKMVQHVTSLSARISALERTCKTQAERVRHMHTCWTQQ